MEIDFDLIRDIIKALNEKQDFRDLNYINPNYTENEISYHLYYIFQKGLA